MSTVLAWHTILGHESKKCATAVCAKTNGSENTFLLINTMEFVFLLYKFMCSVFLLPVAVTLTPGVNRQ